MASLPFGALGLFFIIVLPVVLHSVRHSCGNGFQRRRGRLPAISGRARSVRLCESVSHPGSNVRPATPRAGHCRATSGPRTPEGRRSSSCVRHSDGSGGIDQAHTRVNPCSLSGIERMRTPVAAKIAFVTAGAKGGSAGSPNPVGRLSL